MNFLIESQKVQFHKKLKFIFKLPTLYHAVTKKGERYACRKKREQHRLFQETLFILPLPLREVFGSRQLENKPNCQPELTRVVCMLTTDC